MTVSAKIIALYHLFLLALYVLPYIPEKSLMRIKMAMHSPSNFGRKRDVRKDSDMYSITSDSKYVYMLHTLV